MKGHSSSICKRIRVDMDDEFESDETKSMSNSIDQHENVPSIKEKIVYQKDYLQLMCEYLQIRDLFCSIMLLSTYHREFMNCKSRLPMIKKVLSYDFGDILNIFQIDLNAVYDNNDCNNACMAISPFYNDWEYLMKCAKKARIVEHPSLEAYIYRHQTFDFKPLIKLEKHKAIQHWMQKVLCCLFCLYFIIWIHCKRIFVFFVIPLL